LVKIAIKSVVTGVLTN